MAGQRDRIIKLIDYAKSLGIVVNLEKNKAKGNKGFFKTNDKQYRIDIAKGLSEEEILRVLVHELAHFMHYKNDKTLKSLDFLFQDKYKDYEEDLLSLTVSAVPKDFAQKLFEEKNVLKSKISEISKNIKTTYPDIKFSNKNNTIAKELSKTSLKYLLKYDRVKMLSGFMTKIYSINTIKTDFPNIKSEHYDYIKLCSLKRQLNRINGKISRLNKYYSAPSELFARSLEYYVINPEYMKTKTPRLFEFYTKISNNKESLIADINRIINA